MPTTFSIPLRIDLAFNPSQRRDKNGRWTRAGGGDSGPSVRTGKGFGGMSAPRDRRTPPTPKFSLPPTVKELEALGFPVEGTKKEARRALYKSIYEHDLPGGYKSVVTEIDDSGNSIYIRGEIQNKWGSAHGSFERSITDIGEWYDATSSEPSPYGPEYQNLKTTDGISVYHTSFGMDSDDRAHGVGSAFIAGSVAKYRELGIDHVMVHAGDEVGGYAWAREGFRIEDGMRNKNPYHTGNDYMSRHEQITSIAEHAEAQIFRMGKEREIPDEHFAEMNDAVRALKAASAAGEDVQPIHFASLGEATMRYKRETYDGGFYETWPGKELMLGSNWQGAYYFDASPVTAAGGYNPGQPRDREGQWTSSGYARRGAVAGYGPRALPDVRLGKVRVTYKPDYPDDGPDPGEIVWAKVPFEDDPSQSKDRPVLVIGRVEGGTAFAAVQLTSQVRGRSNELPVGTGSWDRQGRQSALKLDRIVQIDGTNFRREGSVFDHKKFDAVIGQLAAYHRTPVSIVAAGRFNPSQPRDDDGRWTRFRSGITSLYRDTLDRALHHGVAGIFGEGIVGGTPWPTAPRRKGEKVYNQALVTEALRKPPVLEKVDPRMLFATQSGLVKSHVSYYMTDEYKRTGRTSADQENVGNAFPVIYVNKREQHIILSGHHRAAAAMIQGQDLDAIVVREPS